MKANSTAVRILKRETVRLYVHQPVAGRDHERSWLPSKGRVGFGLDFAVRVAQPQGTEAAGTVGEFFWDGAADTLFWVDPVNRIAAVLFTQYMPFGKGAAASRVPRRGLCQFRIEVFGRGIAIAFPARRAGAARSAGRAGPRTATICGCAIGPVEKPWHAPISHGRRGA